MHDTLFIYGSWTEGHAHFHRIREYILEQTPAYMQGQVCRLPVGYPAFSTEGPDWVPGTLIKVQKADVLFGVLDTFHGVSYSDPEKSLYFRRTHTAYWNNLSESAASFVYAINLQRMPALACPIEKGDWPRSLNEKPALPQQLTARQKSYIEKLGQSSGRDIVPIDLALYRELINLDLVVDKGRRLALTALGQDVFRYLR